MLVLLLLLFSQLHITADSLSKCLCAVTSVTAERIEQEPPLVNYAGVLRRTQKSVKELLYNITYTEKRAICKAEVSVPAI